jgi:hypothetical protein
MPGRKNITGKRMEKVMNKDKIAIICQHIRADDDYDKICKKLRISLSTINQLVGSIARVLFWADGHCGSNVGLTPPYKQLKILPNPETTEDKISNKWAIAQKECWEWYINTLELLKPIDKCFILGDAIDGDGSRSGATELITADRKVQAVMATKCIREVDADYYSMVFGTPYHCGTDEDFEIDIAKNLGCKIGGHEWENVNGCTFDLKHKQSNCINPATSLFNDIRDNREWAGVKEQPKADVLVRAHTHRFCITKLEGVIGISLPALQAYGTKFGARQCSRKVQFGLVAVDVWPDGEIVEHIHIARLASHSATEN